MIAFIIGIFLIIILGKIFRAIGVGALVGLICYAVSCIVKYVKKNKQQKEELEKSYDEHLKYGSHDYSQNVGKPYSDIWQINNKSKETVNKLEKGPEKVNGWDTLYTEFTIDKTYNKKQKDWKVYSDLPSSEHRRKKLCRNFNEKYRLYLTEAQIQGIVNASYMSDLWCNELRSMNNKYESIYEWFTGNTKWLRVYLHAFHVMEVTSDIRQQENIVTYSFEEVFKYVDTLSNLALSEKIAKVNDKFYTAFDDVSFMIAYRYLERKGLKHSLESTRQLIKDDEEIDRLLEKYAQENNQQITSKS
ncbi:MAG: hypothetical protein MJ105_05670 [Lachnospiraceae bacterium]|nr:hypothetical protein [Lachnospiraceae bacterium]